MVQRGGQNQQENKTMAELGPGTVRAKYRGTGGAAVGSGLAATGLAGTGGEAVWAVW